MSTALVHAGLTSLEKIENINSRELEMVDHLKHVVRNSLCCFNLYKYIQMKWSETNSKIKEIYVRC